MSDSYSETRGRLETYFDKTASKTWERLTSDAPVSRVRETVRKGRDAMRAALLARLPRDLNGATLLDAGCGTGAMTEELVKRGANVVAVDISPSLLEIAQKRIPEAMHANITFKAGDMLDPAHGSFDYVVAMDSLIHYEAVDIANALSALKPRTTSSIIFTIAPKTALLSAMHTAGKIFPRSDRSPAIIPVTPKQIDAHLDGTGRLITGARVNSGFYISQAMEYCV